MGAAPQRRDRRTKTAIRGDGAPGGTPAAIAVEHSAILDALPAHIALVDSEGTVVSVNKAWRDFARLNGYPGQDAGVGMSYLSICPAAQGPDGMEGSMAGVGLSAVLRGERQEFSLDYPCHSDREQRWYRLTITPIARGDRQSAVVMHVDVTKSKLVQRELEAAQAHAEAASRSKTEFLANMSHELRTPLNAIIGFSQLMAMGLNGTLTAKQTEYLADISNAGTHLLNLVNDILDLSKVEVGHLELTRRAVEARHIIEASIALIGGRARDAGLHLTTSVATNLPLLWADEVRVKQVLVNLLANAVKFTPRGGTVGVIAEGLGDHVAFKVFDTGIGMRPEDVALALEPFSQIDSSLARTYDGAGLGLPLAKRLAELHGGTLTIETEPDVGTSVTVTIPVVESDDVRGEARSGSRG